MGPAWKFPREDKGEAPPVARLALPPLRDRSVKLRYSSSAAMRLGSSTARALS
jgi:hypothetical protein